MVPELQLIKFHDFQFLSVVVVVVPVPVPVDLFCAATPGQILQIIALI